jgi:hypothetical protein
MLESPLITISELLVELAKYALIAYLGRASLDYLKYRLEVLGSNAPFFPFLSRNETLEQQIDSARRSGDPEGAEALIAAGRATKDARAEENLKVLASRIGGSTRRVTPGPLELEI